MNQPFFKLFSVGDADVVVNAGKPCGDSFIEASDTCHAGVGSEAIPQIVTSPLDDDLYKLSMASLVHEKFPNAVVEYEFTNRGGTKFPPGSGEPINGWAEKSILR